jgi:hypothetical protein
MSLGSRAGPKKRRRERMLVMVLVSAGREGLRRPVVVRFAATEWDTYVPHGIAMIAG